MDSYMQLLHQYLSEHQPNYGWRDAESLLEMIYHYYTEDNPVDNDYIKKQFEQVHEILRKLSLAENDRIFLLTVSLCSECEKQAFIAGLQVGVRLFTALAQ
ncbi:MAG: hypothetical protein IKW10_06215 [Oscillospiraceae bacterium]|nr:hypothetical protein [Oscillospiraceae bacterium]